jgi:hypothetical protein
LHELYVCFLLFALNLSARPPARPHDAPTSIVIIIAETSGDLVILCGCLGLFYMM